MTDQSSPAGHPNPAELPSPPLAPRREHVLHGACGDRSDPWFWLRDATDPAVTTHLQAENDYFAAARQHLAAVTEQIVAEIGARVVQDDTSAPVPNGGWEYYRRTRTGLAYAQMCRRRRGSDPAGPEQLLLDLNTLTEPGGYLDVGAYDVTADGTRLLYSTDLAGDERYRLVVRDLPGGGAGSDSDSDRDTDEVLDVGAGGALSADGAVVFYLRMDAAHRPFQVWRHVVGAAVSDDVCVFTEPDERFTVDVHRGAGDAVMLIASRSRTTAEYHWLPANNPAAELRCVLPRRDGVDYTAEYHPGRNSFFLLIDDAGRDFRLAELSAKPGSGGDLAERIAVRSGIRLEELTVLSGHVAVGERTEASTRISVHALTAEGPGTEQWADPRLISGEEAVCSVSLGENAEFDSAALRLEIESLTTPPSSYDVDLVTGERTLVRQAPVAGGYRPGDYVSTREWAPAADGTAIPISLVRHRDTPLDASAPLLLYGYGSYEISMDPHFSALRPSLLDRGVVFAIAHVRGGGELGRRWYDEGRLAAKSTTFSDYVAVADHLVDARYTAAGRIIGRGGSAGGLLMGAAVNLRPELFAAVLAEVPFVDVLTTMEDETLPLTIGEYEEWGDPRRADDCAVIAAYSPYDNVSAQPYPRILATAGLTDPRVGFWEPAKWVQRLRERSTGAQPIYLRTEMEAGHGGPSGRYAIWRDEAELLAFALDAVGAGTVDA